MAHVNVLDDDYRDVFITWTPRENPVVSLTENQEFKIVEVMNILA